jgi:YVTN family beta-propeller protein
VTSVGKNFHLSADFHLDGTIMTATLYIEGIAMHSFVQKSFITASLLSALAFGQNVYKQAGSYPLPGDTGWDYLTYDTTGNRIFIAHGTSILVVDPEGKKLGEVPANGAHGIAIVADKNLGFSSNGKAGTVTVFDLKTLAPIQDIKVGDNPDAIIYDQHSKHVLVMNGKSKDVMAIDPETKKVDATIPLSGKLEFAATAPGKAFVNVEDKGEIAVIDTKTWKATASWKLADCEEPSGLAINEKSDTLFTVCGNSKMLVIDAKNGKVISTVKTGDGTDAAGYDPGTGYAFASNGEGTLTVVKKDGKGYAAAENVPTAKSARTMALDPNSHKVYVVAADFNPPAEGQRRGTIKPGTFRLLVFAPAK